MGGPQQVVYLIDALRERGHDCTLVCPPGSGIDTVARRSGIRVQNLFCAGDLDLPFAYRLVQFLKAERPDIVHCHSRRGADMLGGLAASLADVPAVVSRRVDNTEMRLMAALRYRPFRKVIAISETIATVLRESGIEPGRIVVIRSAVDTDAMRPAVDCEAARRAFGLDDDAIVVAAAGQLIERKGHRYLLEAFAAIRGRCPRLRLLVFGEGELDADLRAQAASLGLDGIVQFAGFRDDLDAFVGCFDIFAHPALSEGLGVAALKASAAGLPVVAFAAGGLVEAVDDGRTGVLVEPADVDALAAALASLAENPAQRRAMGDAGRERMQKEFSVATMAAAHDALYASLVTE